MTQDKREAALALVSQLIDEAEGVGVEARVIRGMLPGLASDPARLARDIQRRSENAVQMLGALLGML